MIVLKALKDLNDLNRQLTTTTYITSHPIIRQTLERSQGLDGYLIVIEKEDVSGVLRLPELKRRLIDIPWEGVTRKDGHYHAVYLTNNEFSLEFLIPDADWLPADLKRALEEQLL
ncbi:MAG: hypothetical protein C0621_09600 [Desulfuromonas sp.]|nr:MAG: hypothetical protein C0621_09600 [Desulfuromonas sp.]